LGASKRRQVSLGFYKEAFNNQDGLCIVCQEWNGGLNPAFTLDTKEYMGFLVCNYCYRGLYGFRYSADLLHKAAKLMEAYYKERG
jgi:hypothetical protein